MKKTPERSETCDCCGSASWRRKSFRSNLHYDVCRRCRLHLISLSDDQRSIAFKVAQASYYGDGTAFTQKAHEMEPTTVRIRRLRHQLPAGSSILEIGPGSGRFAAQAASLGYKVTVIEESSFLAGKLRCLGGVEVICANVLEIGATHRTYDAVCSFHVIEHVSDYMRFLEVANRLAGSRGLLFLATPSSDSMEHNFFSLSPNADEAHLQIFSRCSIRYALHKAGWDIRSLTTPEYYPYWLRVFAKLLRRLMGHSEVATAGGLMRQASRKAGWFLRVYEKLTMPLRSLQASVGLGNEIFIVATKRARAARSM